MNLTLIAKKLIACCCVLMGMASYVKAQKNIPVDSSKIQTLRIDPSNAMGGNASDFFTQINYIPLETTEESLFGSIYKLEVTEDYFIIYDYNTHAILIFNKNGKFHAKITSNQTTPIGGFVLNRFTKQIIYSRDNFKNMIYADYDGKTIETKKFIYSDLAKDQVDGANSFCFSADKAVTYNHPNLLDTTAENYKIYSNSLILFYDNKNRVYATGLQFDKRSGDMQDLRMGIGPFTSFGIDTAFFYSEAYASQVYTITPNNIQLTYKFVFPLYSALPNDFLVNPVYKKKQIEYIVNHPKAIFCISNFYRINDNLIFRATTWERGNKEDVLIYNLKTGTLIAYKHILQDEKTCFLPIYDDLNGGGSFNNFGILACRDGCLYTAVSSLGMFDYHDKYADQKTIYPSVLDNYLKKGSRKDNPVIVQLKLKDAL